MHNNEHSDKVHGLLEKMPNHLIALSTIAILFGIIVFSVVVFLL